MYLSLTTTTIYVLICTFYRQWCLIRVPDYLAYLLVFYNTLYFVIYSTSIAVKEINTMYLYWVQNNLMFKMTLYVARLH